MGAWGREGKRCEERGSMKDFLPVQSRQAYGLIASRGEEKNPRSGA